MTAPSLRIGLGPMLGLLGHAVAWAAWGLLGIEEESPSLPGWATLAMHVGGREVVLAVFALAATLWTFTGMVEHRDEGRPRAARATGLVGAVVIALYAWRWFVTGHPVLGAIGALATIPGLLGPARPKTDSSDRR